MRHSVGLVILVSVLGVRGATAGPDPRLPYVAVPCGNGIDAGRALVVLPQAEQAVVAGENEVEQLTAAATAAKLDDGKRKTQYTGDFATDRGWCLAEKTLKVGKQRVSVIVSSVGVWTGSEGNWFSDTVTVVARALSNAETAKLTKAGKLKRPGALTGRPDDDAVVQLRAALADRAKLKKFWSPVDDVALGGSAPGEVYQGAKARQMLDKWNLQLRLDGPVLAGREGKLVWVLGTVEAKPVKGAATMYRGFFVLLGDHFKADDPPEHETYHLVLAHFSLVQ